MGRLVGAAHFGQQDDEFVAAVAADRIDPAHAAHQAPRHFLEQQVAHMVAHAVVDMLEVVEVQVQHGQHVQLAPRGGQRQRQPVAQQHAVRQVGQEIMFGQVARLFLVFLALADVEQDGHVVTGLARMVADGGQRQPGRIRRAGLARRQEFALPMAVTQHRLPRLPQHRLLFGAGDIDEPPSPQVFQAITADFAVGAIHAEHLLLFVHDDDGLVRMFDYLRGQVERPLGLLARGDIAHHGIEQISVVEGDRGQQHFAPEQLAQASQVTPFVAAIAVRVGPGRHLRAQHGREFTARLAQR